MPYYDAKTFQPCDSIGYMTKRLYKAAHPLIEARFADLDLSFTQWVTLAVVGAGLVDTCAALASHLGHDSGATTRLVDGLERRGLIERHRDGADRRVVRLALTSAGRSSCEALTPRVAEFWNEVLAPFDAAELDGFVATLRRLNQRLAELEAGR